MIKKYDYIIIGSGLFGSICAKELTDKGLSCLVLEKRNHIGGNCFTEKNNNINVHKYGPHIFHTSNDKIWNYINKFAKFNNFTYRSKVNYKNKIYSFPINLMTLHQIFNVKTPIEAKELIENIKVKIDNPNNLEEYIISKIGIELYEIFIKGYTLKQWNTHPKNLPSSIIKRLPIRFNFDDNYYFDKYSGIPIGGYTQIFEKMLYGIETKLNIDYFENKSYWDNLANKIIYTGPIDLFYNYKFGKLNYRGIKFETEHLDIDDFQGNAIINYTDESIPWTRITEHKHFEFGNQPTTIITKEYPENYNGSNEPYYPINDDINNSIYNKYKMLSLNEKKFIFGGRLAEYKYYDMHQVIGSALNLIEKL